MEAFILGLVQGLTEFLPVSSSGHTIIAGKLMGITQIPMAFELIIHLATLLAVIIVMRKDIVPLVKKPFGRDTALILTATVPTVLLVLLFQKLFRASFSGEYLIYCFIVTAILLIVSGIRKTNLIKPKMSFADAAIIGIAQGIAALPGISRSGSTISAAKILGNDSQTSTRFSFLISIPIIIGSAAVELITNSSAMGIGIVPLLVGFSAAFASGLAGIKLMVKVFSSRSLDGFAIYLCLLSVFLLCNDTFLHLF